MAIKQVCQCTRCDKVFNSIKDAEIHDTFCRIQDEFIRAAHKDGTFADQMSVLISELHGSNCAQYVLDTVSKAQTMMGILSRFIDETNKLPARLNEVKSGKL